MAMEEAKLNKTKEGFADLIRSLKLQFRKLLYSQTYLECMVDIYQNQIVEIKKLTDAYHQQAIIGNMAKSEYIRLKALELEFTQKRNEILKEMNDTEKDIKILMRVHPTTVLVVLQPKDDMRFTRISSLVLTDLITRAKDYRPDIKLAASDIEFYKRYYAYEKAKRVPDLNIKCGYDRGGGIFYNFVGFGLSMNIPVFDRNQGTIQLAQLSIQQAQLLFENKVLSVENEVVAAYKNLLSASYFYNQMEDNYEDTLDNMLESYHKSFKLRNISMLDYIDFVEAYIQNKKILLEARKDMEDKSEELNFTIGIDIL